jgi:TPR repeat protein
MKSFWKIVLPVIGVAVIFGTAIIWQEYRTKSNERNYAEEAKTLSVRAEQGNAVSQFDLGQRYYHGIGVEQNFNEAFHWYYIAAEQGNAQAQYSLGYMYQFGQTVPQDYAEAAHWYHKAAEQGNAQAQYGLGYMYHFGQSVPQDYPEAVFWYRKGADQGDVMAQDELGLMYYMGQGVPQDHGEAAHWYRKAAEKGFAKAQYDLGVLYFNGQGVTKDRAEANRWLHKAADQGDLNALRSLGIKRTGFDTWNKIILAVLFLASLFFLMDSLMSRKRIRDKRQRATFLLGIFAGIFGFFYVGLSLYVVVHYYMQHSESPIVFKLIKLLLAAISSMFALLWLKCKNENRRLAQDSINNSIINH